MRTDTPKIDQMMAELTEQARDITEELRTNRAEIDELEAGVRAIGRLRETRARTALVQGRIGFYLEMLDRREQELPIEDRTVELEAEIADIEARLLENGNVDLLTTYLSLINRSLSDKAKSLRLEHSDSPIRLDLRRLTVVADTRNGAVPLGEMGSGENWLGYHLATFLALHEWFVYRKPAGATDSDHGPAITGLVSRRLHRRWKTHAPRRRPRSPAARLRRNSRDSPNTEPQLPGHRDGTCGSRGVWIQ